MSRSDGGLDFIRVRLVRSKENLVPFTDEDSLWEHLDPVLAPPADRVPKTIQLLEEAEESDDGVMNYTVSPKKAKI